MTPMIDIVFLLIIFFLVSSNLIQQDVSMELDLPTAETGRLAEESESKKLTINIPRPGQVLIGMQPADKKHLRLFFLRQRELWGDEAELRIRTNKDVPYGEIEPILVLAAESRIRDVSFAVVEKQGE